MSNADTHRRSVEMFNTRDWSSVAATLAEDCELIDHPRGFSVKGREQWIETVKGWVVSQSDARVTDARVIDGGDTTVLLFTGVGTNDGPLGKLPATGRPLSLPFCEVKFWDASGKTTRAEWYYDQVTILVQLGHMPPPEG
jgi:SnoaL-like polyketide cyclase